MIAQFQENGFYGPVKFLNDQQIEKYKTDLLDAVKSVDLMNSDYRCKSNVLFPWINEISKHETIKNHVAQVLGPNFHCWDTLIWIKDAESDKFVSWHQDATYWNFLPKERGLTVWVTLSGASKDMGCIQYIPGSHKNKQILHEDIKSDGNLLMRGQTATYKEGEIHYAECEPGSFLMHSPFMIHGSEQNTTSTPRLALGLIFVATDAKPIATFSEESTVMVSGVDEYNYMVHDPAPTGNWDKDIEIWKKAYDRQHANYYKMEQIV
jgi:ectoine hydroxylase-related dioxygenase (phytanoyl-CoA dioxygenase family)